MLLVPCWSTFVEANWPQECNDVGSREARHFWLQTLWFYGVVPIPVLPEQAEGGTTGEAGYVRSAFVGLLGSMRW